MRELLAKRILVTIGENDAVRQTAVEMVSPNGLYVRLRGCVDSPYDEDIGWVDARTVKVLDVIGPQGERIVDFKIRMLKDAGWNP